MAKLNEEIAKRVEESEDSGFEPIPDGVYHAKLMDVDTTREGPKGPYWSWEFEIIDEEFKGRKQWNNTSLSPKADFKMKETFAAFGVPVDTDTDDLLGKIVKLVVSQRVIQSGTRQGEVGNQIDRLKPADEDVLAAQDAEAEKKAAEIF